MLEGYYLLPAYVAEVSTDLEGCVRADALGRSGWEFSQL